MKLIDLLKNVSSDTLIGIWNIDNKREKCPTPQTYQKACNIPWDKIKNIVDYEILHINVNDKNSGLLVRIYDKERLQRSINNSDLAKKIKEFK